VKITGALAGAVAGFATAGPMGLVGPVMSLFGGGGGPSAAEQEILAKLDEIDGKLDLVLENQQVILSALKQTSETIIKQNRKILTSISKISEDLDVIKESLTLILQSGPGYSEFNQNLAECTDLRSDALASEETDFGQLLENFEDRSVAFSTCAQWVNGIWLVAEEQQRIHVYLNSAALVGRDEAGNAKLKLESVRNHYRPIVRALWASFGLPQEPSNWNSRQREVGASLLASILTFDDSLEGLKGRPTNLTDAAKKFLLLQEKLPEALKFENSIFTLISVEHLEIAVENLIFISSLIPLIDPSSPLNHRRLLDAASLSKASDFSNNLRNQFNGALATIDLAIMQNRIMSGDVAIPYIANVVLYGSDSEERDSLIDAVAYNPILSENILAYIVNRKLKTTRRLPTRHVGSGATKLAANLISDPKVLFFDNLTHYETLYQNRIDLEGAPNCKVAKTSSLSWECVLGDGLNIENNVVILKKSNAEAVSLNLPSPRRVLEQQLRTNSYVGDLQLLREKLVVAASLFNDDYVLQSNEVVRRFPQELFDF
jgi:hypothetical protein